MKEDWAKHWPAPSVYSQPFLLQHHDATGAHDGRISWALGFIMYLKANKYYWAEILIREAHLKDYKNVPPRRKYAPYPVLLGPCPVVQRGSSDSLQRLSSAWCASRSGWLPSGCSGAAGLSPVPCSGCCPHTDSRANVTAGNERWCFQPQEEEEEEEREEGAAMVVVRAVWGGFGGSKRDGVSLPPSPPSLPHLLLLFLLASLPLLRAAHPRQPAGETAAVRHLKPANTTVTFIYEFDLLALFLLSAIQGQT